MKRDLKEDIYKIKKVRYAKKPTQKRCNMKECNTKKVQHEKRAKKVQDQNSAARKKV